MKFGMSATSMHDGGLKVETGLIVEGVWCKAAHVWHIYAHEFIVLICSWYLLPICVGRIYGP